jgi:Tfp pilus assembly protein PilW
MKIRVQSKHDPSPTPSQAKAPPPQRGFTLVEIMVAGCILSMSVISLYSAYSFGFSLIRLSQENVRADQILVQKLETLRVYPWAQTDPCAGIIPKTFPAQFLTGAAACGVLYQGTIDITAAPVGESYSNTLRQVTVGVSWVSGGVTRSRSMTTFVSQYGIQAL